MSDDVLERVRMCVAEAGYDPMAVWVEADDVDSDGRPWTQYNPLVVPPDVLWRAGEICGMDDEPICLACDRAATVSTGVVGIDAITACLATQRLTLDCGVTR